LHDCVGQCLAARGEVFKPDSVDNAINCSNCLSFVLFILAVVCLLIWIVQVAQIVGVSARSVCGNGTLMMDIRPGVASSIRSSFRGDQIVDNAVQNPTSSALPVSVRGSSRSAE